MVSASDRAGGPLALLCVLAVGQLGGHLVLSAGGHQHVPEPGPSTDIPAPVMLLAHLTAVAFGAILIAACERLYLWVVLSDPRRRPSCPDRSRQPDPRSRGTTIRPSPAARTRRSPRRYRTEVPRPRRRT